MIQFITFEYFMEQVDQFLDTNLGVVSDDLPDFNYRAAYDAGYKPDETAADAWVEASVEYLPYWMD